MTVGFVRDDGGYVLIERLEFSESLSFEGCQTSVRGFYRCYRAVDMRGMLG